MRVLNASVDESKNEVLQARHESRSTQNDLCFAAYVAAFAA
jgi:hypothetical protein